MVLAGSGASAQVVRVADLNTRQIRALDRDKTVVFLQGGMLEEHGPYLPAFTDGILSERLTQEIAQGIVAKKPDWTALLFPPVSVGASGYNEIGRQFVFPGTYAVRPSTLRAMYMDLATQLGEQGFKWIMVVHVHGSPLHIAALDEAGDYFRDTYGGRMVNLWGLLPVIGGWGTGMSAMTDGAEEGRRRLAARRRGRAFTDAASPAEPGRAGLPAGAVGHRLDATPRVSRPPRQKDWPGYIGAPRLGNAALGRRIWTSFSAAALKTTLEILDGRGSREVSEVPADHGDEPVVSGVDRIRHRARSRDRRAAAGVERAATGGRDGERRRASSPPSRRRGTRRISASDAAALDRLWADDIVIFVPRMAPMGKARGAGDVQGRRRDVHPLRDVRPSPARHRRPGHRDGTAAADAQLQRARGLGRLAVQEGLPARRLGMARDQLSRVGTAEVGSLGDEQHPVDVPTTERRSLAPERRCHAVANRPEEFDCGSGPIGYGTHGFPCVMWYSTSRMRRCRNAAHRRCAETTSGLERSAGSWPSARRRGRRRATERP